MYGRICHGTLGVHERAEEVLASSDRDCVGSPGKPHRIDAGIGSRPVHLHTFLKERQIDVTILLLPTKGEVYRWIWNARVQLRCFDVKPFLVAEARRTLIDRLVARPVSLIAGQLGCGREMTL